jgi:hypothetical protein
MTLAFMLDGFSIFTKKVMYVDTKDYLADNIFVNQKLRILKFDKEWGRAGCPYVLICCTIWKKDANKFLKCMELLRNKMLLFGHTDYEEFLKDVDYSLHKAEEKGDDNDG